MGLPRIRKKNPYDKLSLVRNEDVIQFDVAVRDFHRVDMVQPYAQLCDGAREALVGQKSHYHGVPLH